MAAMVGKAKLVAAGVVVLVALVLGGSAFAAQKPKPYRGQGGNVQSQVQKAKGAKTLGSLPFTGLDLALVVGGGLVLLLSGAALRRASKRRTA